MSFKFNSLNKSDIHSALSSIEIHGVPSEKPWPGKSGIITEYPLLAKYLDC